jgi:cardiolipin synthase A/B
MVFFSVHSCHFLNNQVETHLAPESRRPFGISTVGPNRVLLLRDGLQAYPLMLDAIARAQRTVCLETYILQHDNTGRKFLDALSERAQAGVLVMLMYDGWGSAIPDNVYRTLKRTGIHVHIFRPVTWSKFSTRIFQQLSRRNHRKSLVVDSIIGFTGGLNIADEYAAVEDGGHGWRDTHVCVEGPGAVELEQHFLHTWRMHAKRPVALQRFRHSEHSSPKAAPTARLRFIGSDFASTRKRIRRAYVDAFSRARERICLTNAYFLPPPKMLKALLAASRRGVRVQVIVGAKTDVKLVLYAIRGLYALMLRAGVEVYEWNERILHAKTAVIDGHWSTVGSSNLDSLSLRRNLELNAVIDDPGFGEAMQRLFEADRSRCLRITPDIVSSFPIVTRLLSWFSLKLRRWL